MNLVKAFWSVIIGLIAFIVALWIISIVDGTMQYGHLLAVLIGLAVGVAVYFRSPWWNRTV